MEIKPGRVADFGNLVYGSTETSSQIIIPGCGAHELGAVEQACDESDGEAEGVEEGRVAADGVLPLVVSDAVPEVSTVVDQVVMGHQCTFRVARRAL